MIYESFLSSLFVLSTQGTMVPEKEKFLSLSNSLATVEQLSTSSSSLDGVSSDLEASIRYAGLQVTQAAGILLQLSQDIVVQAMVLFTRFYLGPEGGSFRVNSAKVGQSFHYSHLC